MYKNILIATDGSELAAKGVEHGLGLAAPLGARVTVLTVSRPLPPEAAEAALASGVTDPVLRYARAAAHGLVQPAPYIDAVMSATPTPGPARLRSATVGAAAR